MKSSGIDCTTAKETYFRQHIDISTLLASIANSVEDLPEPEHERIHWGHVGTMNAIANQLREAKAMLDGMM